MNPYLNIDCILLIIKLLDDQTKRELLLSNWALYYYFNKYYISKCSFHINTNIPENINYYIQNIYGVIDIDSCIKYNNLKTIKFDNNCNIKINTLIKLSKLKHLYFNIIYNEPINLFSKLTNLETLYLSVNFNQLLGNDKKCYLPTSLINLTIGMGFYKSIKCLKYLKNLQTLIFDDYSNFDGKIVVLSSLSNLKILKFGLDFDRSIDTISKLTNLTILNLGNSTYTIDKLYTLINLTTLTLGLSFNSSIDIISKLTNLETLKFGSLFNKSIDYIKNLTKLCKLKLANNFNNSIATLPKSLTKLIIGQELRDYQLYLIRLSNLKSLKLNTKYNKFWNDYTLFPKSLRILKIPDTFDLNGKIKSYCFKNKIKLITMGKEIII